MELRAYGSGLAESIRKVYRLAGCTLVWALDEI